MVGVTGCDDRAETQCLLTSDGELSNSVGDGSLKKMSLDIDDKFRSRHGECTWVKLFGFEQISDSYFLGTSSVQ